VTNTKLIGESAIPGLLYPRRRKLAQAISAMCRSQRNCTGIWHRKSSTGSTTAATKWTVRDRHSASFTSINASSARTIQRHACIPDLSHIPKDDQYPRDPPAQATAVLRSESETSACSRRPQAVYIFSAWTRITGCEASHPESHFFLGGWKRSCVRMYVMML
jgi:hypothetical protein